MRALSSSNGDGPGTAPGVQEMEWLLRSAVHCTDLSGLGLAGGVCSYLSGLGLAGGTLMELLLAIMLFGKLRLGLAGGTGLGPFFPPSSQLPNDSYMVGRMAVMAFVTALSMVSCMEPDFLS